MTRIGLHLPYARQEATHLGLSLAQLGKQLGHSVSWLSSQAHEVNVDPAWDGKTLSGKKQDFKSWCRRHRCGHVIWADVQPEKLQLAKGQGCSNTLLFLWHRFNEADEKYLDLFDWIICPTHEASQAFLARFGRHDRCRVIPWDTGSPCHEPRPAHDTTAIFLPLEGTAASQHGPLIVHNVELLMARRNDVTVTIGHGKHWDHATHYAVERLQVARPQRVTTLRRRNWRAWRETQRAHQWTLLPSLSCNTGYQALDSLFGGVPVVAFDIAPISEAVKDRHNGVLIPCNVKTDWLEAPTAVFNSRQLLDAMDQTLTESVRCKLIEQRWTALLSRRQDFIAVWESLWG